MKEVWAAWPSFALAQQQIDKLWEEMRLLILKIEAEELKIEKAIEANKPQRVIDVYEVRRVRLVEMQKETLQTLSNLQTQLAAGNVLPAA